jgi:perosamine synthetase
MNPREISVGAKTSIRDTLAAIDRGGLGLAIVVDERDRLIGLATDGDIRRALLRGASLDAPVADAMRRDPVTVREGTSLDEVRRLSSDRVRHIPVLDEQGRVTDLTTYMLNVHIPVAAPRITERALRYVTDCIVSNWISSGGPYVQRFEQAFAEFCEASHAVATSNGTTALHLALAALGVGPGDEVIVPTLTFVATANAVRYVGGTPVFVDSEPRTWNLDPDRVIAAITERTKAIIPVHLYGHPADLGPILDAATKRGIHVIEDAAEAHGALYRGRRVGALGTAGTFSFYGNKIITTGEGGMVVTNDADLARRLRFLRDHAMDPARKYWHTEVGFNYRLTNLQAAVGVAQMEEIDSILERKVWQAATYRRLLDGMDVTLPPAESWATNVHWMFSILVPAGRRDAVMIGLSALGVDSRPFFSCVHLMPMYGGHEGEFPVAEDLSERGLNLPSGVDLTRHEIEFTVEALKQAMGQRESTSARH